MALGAVSVSDSSLEPHVISVDIEVVEWIIQINESGT